MNKKIRMIMALCLAVCMMFQLTGCGAGKNGLVGTWELTDGEGSNYGWGIRFEKNNKFYYAVGGEEGNEEEMQEAFEALDVLYTIKYKVVSDSKIALTISVFGGLGGKETVEVDYSLQGDMLEFDGATYRRIK